MSVLRFKAGLKSFKMLNFTDKGLRTKYCKVYKFPAGLIERDNNKKTDKIDKIISNIYVYKTPPVLKWPDGVYFDIPVDYVIAIRRAFENSDETVINNVNELCFALQAENGSYGDGILVIPYEYITGTYDKKYFLDVLAHELGHAMVAVVKSNKNLLRQVEGWHKIIRFNSVKTNNLYFFNPGGLDLNLSNYQFEDVNEFLSELFSQIMNYYEELIRYICNINIEEVQMAYLNALNFLLNYVKPFDAKERSVLINNL